MIAIPVAACLVIVGCGGEDDAGGNDTAANPRAALADYLYASADNDPAAVCDALTDEGRTRQVEDAIRLEIAETGDDCEETAAKAFRSFGEQRETIADDARKLADGIKSGEVDGAPVKVDTDSGVATVTFKIGDQVFRASVERIDGGWRLADSNWAEGTPEAADN